MSAPLIDIRPPLVFPTFTMQPTKKVTEHTSKCSSNSTFLPSLAVPELPLPLVSDDRVFKSSDRLSAQDEATLYQMLSDVNVGIVSLDNLVDQLNLALSAAKLARSQHVAFAERYKESLPPIRQIPDDVLARVFECAVESHVNTTFDSSFFRCTPPMVLSHVSRRWRGLALHTPSIWAGIRIRAGEIFRRTLLILVQIWIARSGSYPLTIDLSIASSQHTSMHRTLLDMLVQQSHRWRTVYFDLPYSLYQCSAFPISRPTPLLEKAHLTAPALSHISTFTSSGMFSHTPSLTTVLIKDFSLNHSSFHWYTVTDLRIDNLWPPVSQDTLSEILRLSKSLKRLVIRDPPYRRSPEMVTMPHLESLEIRGSWTMLDDFTALSLQTFRLNSGSSGDPRSIVSFLSRSPALRSLYVDAGVDISFLNDLEEPSSIRQLFIEVHRRRQEQPLLRLLSDRFLNELSHGQKPFPMLEELSFTVADGDRPEHLSFLADLRDILLGLAGQLDPVGSVVGGKRGNKRFEKLHKVELYFEGEEGSVGFEMFAAIKELGIYGLEIRLVQEW